MLSVAVVRWWAGALALACLVLGGADCNPVPAVSPAPAPLAKLVWFVEPVAVVTPAQGFVAAAAFPTSAPQAFKRALVKAGYAVIEDPHSSHDVVAKVTINVTSSVVLSTTFINATGSVSVLAPDSTVLDDVAIDSNRNATTDAELAELPDILAAKAVNKIGESARIARFAEQRDRSSALAMKDGAPSSTQAAATGTSCLVPADGDPQFLDATAIAMSDVLAKLAQSKAREVLAIVDSCFPGAGGRSVLPPGARPLVRVREEAAPAQLALFSASGPNEISGPVAGGSGGVFTKYLVDGLGTGAADTDGNGQVSLGELAHWVAPRVSREAKTANRDQNPTLAVGKGLGSADTFIVEWGLAAK